MLHAAKRQTRIGSNHAVDKDRSSVEFIDEAHLFLRIVCPCRGPETKRRCIRKLDCLIDAADSKQRSYGPEDFIAIRRRLFRDISEHRGLIEVAARNSFRKLRALAADQDLRARGDAYLHLFLQISQNLFSRQRTDVSRLVQRIANPQRLHAFNKSLLKLFINLRMNDEALSG